MTQKMRASWAQSYAEWAVLLLVAVALVAGWGVRAYAEGRVEHYTADGLTVAYPADWRPSKAADGTLRFRDLRAGGVPPTLSVRQASLARPEVAAEAVAMEADSLALTRGQNWTAYTTLSTDAQVTFRGQPARRVSYAYVQDGGNAFLQQVPVVMQGEDLVAYQAGRVYVFSLQAPESEFARVRRHLQTLVDSAVFELSGPSQ